MDSERITKRLEALRSQREQHQQQLAAYQQAVQQLTAQIYAESGAIAELEELLKPEAKTDEAALAAAE